MRESKWAWRVGGIVLFYCCTLIAISFIYTDLDLYCPQAIFNVG